LSKSGAVPKDWLLKLNVNKCKVVSFERNVDNSYVYELIENNQSLHLARTNQITDLDERLTFKEHIDEKVNKAYSMKKLQLSYCY